MSMIKLHPDCRTRLIETITDAISSLVVTNGKFISYSSTTKLVTADKVIPTSGTVRDQLTTNINETPISTFVVDQLQSELLPKQYQLDAPSMNLTEIGEYEYPKQVAERLVDQISSLPWQYKLTIRLPQQLVPLLPPNEDSIVLRDQIELMRADDNFQHRPVWRFNSGLESREHFARFLRSRYCARIVKSHTQIYIFRPFRAAAAIVTFYRAPAAS